MLQGMEYFKEFFEDYKDSFVLIGGTACSLLMQEASLPFRATKDIDMVLVLEVLSPAFGKRFWEYIKEGGYEHRNKGTGEAQYYRFSKPKSTEYPKMIELFSRKPDTLLFQGEGNLSPIPMEEDCSSLSAILLDDSYYSLLMEGRTIIDGLPLLDFGALIPFKAKAWLDLSQRQMQGERIDSLQIRKHKNDVFRIVQLLSENTKITLPSKIQKDMQNFVSAMQEEHVDMQALGMPYLTKESILDLLKQCYSLT